MKTNTASANSPHFMSQLCTQCLQTCQEQAWQEDEKQCWLTHNLSCLTTSCALLTNEHQKHAHGPIFHAVTKT